MKLPEIAAEFFPMNERDLDAVAATLERNPAIVYAEPNDTTELSDNPAVLPADQPRYFMGLGDPVGIVEAVALGVDMMDCVLPTRLGRHGTLLTSSGRVNIKRAEFARSDEPIDPACGCEVCGRYSRGYLRHLMSVGEPTASTLCTLHNVAWLLAFVDSIRAAIESGTLDRLRAATAEVWA